jgi:hypothetical protein
MDENRGCATPQFGYIIILAIVAILSLLLGVGIAFLFLGGIL